VTIVLQLLLLLVAARLCGRASAWIGQPAAFGEMLAGVLIVLALGMVSAPPAFLATIATSPTVALVGEGGIFLLLLATGIEMKPEEITAHSRQALWVALGGAAVPFAAGFAFAWLILPETGYKQAQAMIVGTGLAITAIPVAAEVLRELNLLHKPIGEVILAAAILDDVVGLILLAATTAVIVTGGFPTFGMLAVLGGKTVLFFAVAIALGRFAMPPLWRLVSRVRAPGIHMTVLVASALIFSLIALFLDMHAVLGAFVSGLFFSPAVVGEAVYQRLKRMVDTLTFGFVAPVFFAWIGLQISLGAVVAIPWVVVALIFIAMAGKTIGAGLPALMNGFNRREALAVGVGMTGRGAVELVVLSIAYQAGVFASNGDHPVVRNLFSALVVTAVASTLAMPILLRWVLSARPSRP
jgi:Kef-type K+ transport system membrane component KefB